MTTNINVNTVPQYNRRNNPKFKNQNQAMLTEPDLNDMFVMQDMQSKKEKQQENLQKLGVYSSIVIAVALLGSLISGIITKSQNAKQYTDMIKSFDKEFGKESDKQAKKIFNVEFEKLTDNKNIADIKTTKTRNTAVNFTADSQNIWITIHMTNPSTPTKRSLRRQELFT